MNELIGKDVLFTRVIKRTGKTILTKGVVKKINTTTVTVYHYIDTSSFRYHMIAEVNPEKLTVITTESHPEWFL